MDNETKRFLTALVNLLESDDETLLEAKERAKKDKMIPEDMAKAISDMIDVALEERRQGII